MLGLSPQPPEPEPRPSRWTKPPVGGDSTGFGERPAAICSNRSVTLVDRGLEPLEPDDRLFVVSGLNVKRSTTRAALDYVRRETRHGVRIGAICSGAYALAMAGLLDGKPCALHWDYHDAFAKDSPDVILRHSVFVAGKNVMTSSGGRRPRT